MQLEIPCIFLMSPGPSATHAAGLTSRAKTRPCCARPCRASPAEGSTNLMEAHVLGCSSYSLSRSPRNNHAAAALLGRVARAEPPRVPIRYGARRARTHRDSTVGTPVEVSVGTPRPGGREGGRPDLKSRLLVRRRPEDDNLPSEIAARPSVSTGCSPRRVRLYR